MEDRRSPPREPTLGEWIAIGGGVLAAFSVHLVAAVSGNEHRRSLDKYC